MHFKLYIKEIKSRGILTVFCWVVSFSLCLTYKEVLLYVCLKPSFNTEALKIHFITTNVFEVFASYLAVAHLLSNCIVGIFFIYQTLTFLLPSMYNNEILIVKKFFNASFLFLIFSSFLFYTTLFPICWEFFLGYLPFSHRLKIAIFFEPKLQEYLEIFSYVYFLTCLKIQFLVLLIFYTKLTKNKTRFLKQYKKTYVFLLFVLAAFVTPPDVFSQCILVLLLLVLLETVKYCFLFSELFLKRQPIKAY
jgi:sec-independent protein translocase protein TatC